MKKIIISVACVLAAVSGFAQVTVAFQNTATSTILFNTNALANKATAASIGSQTGTASTGVVDVGLWWSTSAFTTLANGTFAGFEQMSSTAGLVNGTQVFSLGNSTAQNETVFIQVIAWDNSYGDTAAGAAADLAAGGYFGAFSAGTANSTYGDIGSALSVVLGASSGPGTPIFSPSGTLAKDIMLVQPVPEPATIALGGLGAAALLLFRRRK